MPLEKLVPARLRPPRIFYGWYIVLSGAVNNFLVLGVVIFGFGAFVEPIRAEMGWTMAALAGGVSLRSFEQGFLSPVMGYLVDRLGPRKMALTGVTVLAVGLLMFSQARDIWSYYLASLVIALGQSLGSFTPFSLAVMNWFLKQRGRAMGFLNAGNGFGYFAVPILAALISAFGWRATLMMAAATIFVVGIPLVMILRPRPEPYGYLPDGEPWDAAAAQGSQTDPAARVFSSSTGVSVGEAVRTPAFYLLALAGIAGGMVQTTWVSLQVPHLHNVGFSVGEAGLFVAVYGGIQVVLRIGAGWLGDSIGRRRLYIMSFLFQGIGLLIFANLTAARLWLVPFYYATFGLGHASWVVLGQTVVADYFGTKRFATIRGLIQEFSTPFSVASPIFAGWMFDRTGNFHLVFTLYAFVVMTGALWMVLIRRPLWGSPESDSLAVSPAKVPA